MPSPQAASSPLRFLTPGQMAICLVLFFLPWVEIQCPMPKGGAGMGMGGFEPKPGKAAPDSKDFAWTGFLSQSGLQVATGKYSFVDPSMEKMAKMEKGDKKSKDGKDGKDGKDEGPDAAPLIWVYFLAVAAAVVVGFVMPAGGKRKVVLAACCGGALLVAAGQAAMGFPISKAMKEDATGKKGNAADDMFGGLAPKTVLKFPFYLSLALCVGGLVTALIEPTGPAKPRGYRRNDGGSDGGGAFMYADGGDGGGGGGDGGGGSD